MLVSWPARPDEHLTTRQYAREDQAGVRKMNGIVESWPNCGEAVDCGMTDGERGLMVLSIASRSGVSGTPSIVFD
jgi:hypothetical protein